MTADSAVISYPSNLNEWGVHQIETAHFRTYLKRSWDDVDENETVEEFVGVGCCGSTLDVPLRLEELVGGDRIGEGTVIAYETRERCELEDGWQIQSAGR